ncbi:endo-beta-1,4-glucanase D-like protein [Hapsidospora chrysogenum ATCC 11550]|uniref:lytic cellulose monooxygenase (C4-dehydrogenating) n=1 Tax=Hapsidospora chrysogenum (strain ATCC 11550 / CBS 779.69 / DSM 880 / IAM 14645 / JCM 23072 / IMI 49137) TaxID=857340 RepID=A0A086T2V9_HAPC1|nr:endo-beta-1,4-glucanase D-like protein [Hapsidospora chrysogenum ATCC 11550]
MKTAAFAAAAAAAQVASAHYFFDVVAVNGQASAPFQHIRDFTRQTKYNPIKFSSNPPEDIRDGSFVDGDDIRCNQGAFQNAGNTEVLTVNAGDELTFTLGVGATMQHPGPSFVYMSRAPGDDVRGYDGSGEWFKIFEEAVCNQGADFTTNAWCSWDRNTISATIPPGTPDGEYLVRVEHIGVHRSHVNQPEHYVSCAQVRVQGGGGGNPGPTTQFPGNYQDSDAYANFNIYVGYQDFPIPGPAVWQG